MQYFHDSVMTRRIWQTTSDRHATVHENLCPPSASSPIELSMSTERIVFETSEIVFEVLWQKSSGANSCEDFCK